MKTGPLTHAQAIAQCFYYQHLRGAPLNDQYCIDLVLVAPFGAEQQEQYLDQILNEETDTIQLPTISANQGFDVVVIAFKITGIPDLRMKPLRVYLKEFAPLYGLADFICSGPNVLHQTGRTINFN